MVTKKIVYGDLSITCADDKSYCWANVVSTHQVESLHKYAENEGYKMYLGRTPSGNFYGVIDGDVRLFSAEHSPFVVKGSYRDGDLLREGYFRVLVTEEKTPEETATNVVAESLVKDDENNGVLSHSEEENAPPQLVPESNSEEEEIQKEISDVAKPAEPNYKELYDELVVRYNETVSALTAIRSAFAVIKELLK